MNETLRIRNAEPYEASYLSELAIRSKSYWGYSAKFMAACRNELVVSIEKIENEYFHYMAAERQGEVVGFYALEHLSESDFELEALFVEPRYIGTGIGKALISHAKSNAASLGGDTLIIQGDPNAEKFYLAAGGRLTGKRESASILSRFLPTFSISLANEDVA
ncbi:MAG: GNAT family N-acetyltransferase [Gammaproteobacteria bacterium]|nr:GNAT family N-acetyltransferase [Gammaproteobacteria bacterium]